MCAVKVTKMEGCGNDFVLVEINEAKNWKLNELAEKLCDRHYGVGADGAIFVKKDPVEFIYYNADGSYSPFCGNGMRCFAKYCVDHRVVEEKRFAVKCDRWNVMCEVEENKVTVYIPSDEIEYNEIDGELILVCGSKHKVIEVENLEEQEEKQSDRYNLSYVKMVDEQTILIKTIERGAGPTLACGSGSYASAMKIYSNEGSCKY